MTWTFKVTSGFPTFSTSVRPLTDWQNLALTSVKLSVNLLEQLWLIWVECGSCPGQVMAVDEYQSLGLVRNYPSFCNLTDVWKSSLWDHLSVGAPLIVLTFCCVVPLPEQLCALTSGTLSEQSISSLTRCHVPADCLLNDLYIPFHAAWTCSCFDLEYWEYSFVYSFVVYFLIKLFVCKFTQSIFFPAEYSLFSVYNLSNAAVYECCVGLLWTSSACSSLSLSLRLSVETDCSSIQVWSTRVQCSER